jgi:cytochrome c553
MPSLAGQPDEFTQWQLVYFRSGTRKDQAMQPIAESLEANDVRNLGAYFASLPPPKPTSGQDAGSEAGAKLAAEHRCAFCHGAHFEGNKATARLAGQREDYLYKALSDFKSGARVGSGVASMADVVYSLQDDDLKLPRITWQRNHNIVYDPSSAAKFRFPGGRSSPLAQFCRSRS